MKKNMVYFFLFIPIFYANAQIKRWTVSQDGSSMFTKVQDAFDAVPIGNTDTIIIYVKKGTYKERLVLDSRKNFVKLVGENKKNTILTFDNHAGIKLANGDTINTWSSASFFIYADNFTAENISFSNEAGFRAGQAVAVFANGDRLAFTDCNFTGFQDVLFCSGTGTKQFYKDCYIEGTTDFIFGPATAVFENCTIRSKKNSHVTAASTPREIPYGFVFIDCKLIADSAINKVSLGRPWQPYASVTYIHCYLGDHIIAEGWNNWRNVANEATARYAEYKNYGPGASPSQRVKWIKQLSDEEVKEFSLQNILGDWTPYVLLQKFPAGEFMITAKMNFVPDAKSENEKAGLTVMGLNYASLSLKNNSGNRELVYAVCKNADDNEKENEQQITKLDDGKIYLRVKVSKNGKCQFSYSFDEKLFTIIADEFVAKEGKWIGAKAGIFCTGEKQGNDTGYADFD